jgi:pimeloyl-ACP methyl ester carboxylesterase
MRDVIGPSEALDAVESRWPVRGRKQAAIEWGGAASDPGAPAGEGPVWVLLHGFLDHAGSWEGVALGLDGWRIALDHRGHGCSPWVDPYDSYHFPDYLADLDAVLTAVVSATGRPVRLVGHSMGGTIATLYAGARPENVACVVSVDGLGLYDGAGEVADRLLRFLEGSASPPKAKVYADVAAAASRLRSTYPSLDVGWAMRLARRGTHAVPGGVAWRYDPRHKARAAVPYRQGHHIPLLERIRCPVLSVHPEHETFAEPDILRIEAAVHDLRRVTVPGTTHMVHLQEPAALARALGAFASAVGAPPSL